MRINWQLFKFIFVILLGLIMSLSAPNLKAQVITPNSNSRPISNSDNPQSLLQQGIKAYQTQNFSVAIAFWQQAITSFVAKGDHLSQGLVLSNISLAYQHLGQLPAAQQAISESLQLLNTLENHSSVYAEILAKAWNTQGRLFWEEGKLQDALKAWEKATHQYAIAAHLEGIIGTKLNQVKVLQALGLNLQAKEILTTVKQNLESIEDNQLKAVGIGQLGLNLRQIGELVESRRVLEQGLLLAINPDTQSYLLLELGNTERALEQQKLAIGKFQEAKKYSEAALKSYQEAAKISSENGQLLSLLNQFSLFVDNGQWETALKLTPLIQEKIKQLSPSRDTVYAHLNLAHNLVCLKQSIDNNDFSCIDSAHREQLTQQELIDKVNLNTPSWNTIAQIIAAAIEQSQQLDDPLIKSLALGQMGELYEITQQWNESQKLTQQALLLLEENKAPELSYRWEWQLGRLFKKQGNISDAIAFYQAAVHSLKAVGGDLITVGSDIQFSFRDQVEPVYRQLVELLLTANKNFEPSQENLHQAIEQIEALQVAEIENFLGCQLKTEISVEQNLNQIDPKAAFIYPIILPERLEIIVKLPGQPLTHHQKPVSQKIVKKAIANLRFAILRRNASEVTKNAIAIYQWLIEPLEKELQANPEIETLVFVLDGELRNIPLGVLYDAKKQQYLIEKNYALALLPSTKLFQKEIKKLKQLKFLGAGISKEIEVENRYFTPLNVTAELKQIEQLLPGKILLNTKFTSKNLQDNLNQNDYSIVHIATHGNFSSDPQETFILAYSDQEAAGKLLRPNDIDRLLRGSEQESSSRIDLLVLSACQTALGDNRATLGLAGLAVKSGANSTLATLWQVSDESTVKLMEIFYGKLNQLDINKAQALHLAQLTLLKEQKYQNPYYWASYVLVGNWR